MKRTARLASLALVGVLAFTACGNDDPDEPATAGDPVSSDATGHATGGSPDETKDGTTAEEPAEGEEVDLQAFLDDLEQGAAAITSGHMTMELRAGGQSFAGEGDIAYEDGRPLMVLTMTMPGAGETEIRVIGTDMYLRIPGVTGKKFMKTDLSDPNNPLGDMSDMLDPAKAFAQYREGYTSVRFVGEDEVQGETMRHYVARVDPSRVDALKGQPGVDQLPPFTFDLWLDDEDRVRQAEAEMAVAGQTMTMEMSLTDIGKDVDVQAPPPSQVTRAPRA